MKVVKLKNIYTGETVVCEKFEETVQSDGKVFVRVYKEENPLRTFLVNREAFVVLNK